MNTKLLTAISVIAITGAMAGLSTSVNAADFSYNYVEGAYENFDFNGPDGDVYRISGSYDVAPHFNIIAEFATGDIDNPAGGGDRDFDEGVIGVGYHTSVARNTDFTGNIKVIDQDIEQVRNDTGYGLGVGIRHMFTHDIEGDVNVDFVDVDDDNDTALTLGARYYFTSAISAGLAYSTSSEDIDVISGNVRWNF